MESVIHLPTPLYAKKTERTEAVVQVVGTRFNKLNKLSDEKASSDTISNREYFKRGHLNMSVRGRKSSSGGLGNGSVRRSVKNFEKLLNGKSLLEENIGAKVIEDQHLGNIKANVVQDKPLPECHSEEGMEKFSRNGDTFLAKFAKKRKEISGTEKIENCSAISCKNEDLDGMNAEDGYAMVRKRVDAAQNNIAHDDLYDQIPARQNKVSHKKVKESLADISISCAKEDICVVAASPEPKSNMCTQTNPKELKRKTSQVPLPPLPTLDSREAICSSPAGEDVPCVQNPMHVINLNLKSTKKGKNGSNPPRVVKRRMSVSGEEQAEKFSRLTRFGSGLRKKLSASTRDLFGSGSSYSPPTSPKDDSSSFSGSTRGFKRQLSSSMRDLFGGSFNLKGEKEVRDRFGKSEERRKDYGLKQSAFLIGGGITIGRSAGRSRAAFRDSFRDMLPKLRLSRVFEVNVVLPDGTETSVMGSDRDTIDHVLSPLLSALKSSSNEIPQVLAKISSSSIELDKKSPDCPPSLSHVVNGLHVEVSRKKESLHDVNGDLNAAALEDNDPQRVHSKSPLIKEPSDASMSSMDYQSLSSESEMSIAAKSPSESSNERSGTSLSSEFSLRMESRNGSKTPAYSGVASSTPIPFTPDDLSVLLKQNITPSELSERSLELLKAMDSYVKTYTVVMKDTGAEVETSLPGYLLDGDTIVLIENKTDNTSDKEVKDGRECLVRKLVESERLYRGRLKTLEALYGRPLRRLSDSVTPEESSAILGLLEPVIDASQEITDKFDLEVSGFRQEP
ncbi:uncharacterized protein LOC108675164 [Hyalella azteca]|uniref:Uncharacterized protein LOC108675164 n=1 Tax=Hyalella azteca TaxID=294128 RepID=A0A8B7NXZ2_HYAAZ|nr:uncharacterized protein LOC108675164 [Hyalella azteca]